ncbi:MAG: biotin synthase BioB [Candidatus Limivicinus sp.]
MNKKEITEVLTMPRAEYEEKIMKPAFELLRERKGGVAVSAMLGYSNICKNKCLYCGMRAPLKLPCRYRFRADEVLGLAQQAFDLGLRRLFLISGEDLGYPFEDILSVVSGAKAQGFTRVSLAAGEFSKSQYEELKAAGLDEYVMKFEMSHRDTFNRLNPSTSFEKRNQGIEWIKEAGLMLASGNIVDYPGQTVDELADDILLMKELGISWAPNIPYMPVPGTPLAVMPDGSPAPRGRIDMMHREISLVRLLLPDADITAQQPGEDLREGLGGRSGNQAAVRAGANLLFVDMLPSAMAGNFRVVDNRLMQSLDTNRSYAEELGLPLIL